MSVTYCYICASNLREQKLYGQQGLAEGLVCPLCYQPACRYHLTTVRWRWRETGETEAALVCKDCKRSYVHRQWDVHQRDWIT